MRYAKTSVNLGRGGTKKYFVQVDIFSSRSQFFRFINQCLVLVPVECILFKNHSCDYVSSNTLRVTRAAALQGQDGGSTTTAGYVGKKGKDFEFGHVLPIQVEFAECSAKGQGEGEADLDAVEKWLEKIA